MKNDRDYRSQVAEHVDARDELFLIVSTIAKMEDLLTSVDHGEVEIAVAHAKLKELGKFLRARASDRKDSIGALAKNLLALVDNLEKP